MPLPAGSLQGVTLGTIDVAGNVQPISQANPLPVVGTTVTPPATVSVAASLTVVNTAGTVASGAQAVSFANTGQANATVAGGILAPGQTVSFNTQVGSLLTAITYSATDSLMIAQVR